MATYTKCDRCGDSTERRSNLKFYSLTTEFQGHEYEHLSVTKQICADCASDLKFKWLTMLVAA